MCPETELRNDINTGKLINYSVLYRNYSRLLKIIVWKYKTAKCSRIKILKTIKNYKYTNFVIKLKLLSRLLLREKVKLEWTVVEL